MSGLIKAYINLITKIVKVHFVCAKVIWWMYSSAVTCEWKCHFITVARTTRAVSVSFVHPTWPAEVVLMIWGKYLLYFFRFPNTTCLFESSAINSSNYCVEKYLRIAIFTLWRMVLRLSRLCLETTKALCRHGARTRGFILASTHLSSLFLFYIPSMFLLPRTSSYFQ